MPRRQLAGTLTLLLVASAFAAPRGDPMPVVVFRTESFDKDPGWEGLRNRQRPREGFEVVQDFGWRSTGFAGKAPGEIGGRITRSTTPAYYGDRIRPRSLRDPLVAKGSFAVLAGSKSSSGVFFGWFHSDRQGWRPANFLGFRIDATDREACLHLDYTTATFKSGSINTNFRFPIDGAKRRWQLTYDPRGGDGQGVIRFSLGGGQSWTLELLPGHQWENAEFNRFGMFNVQSPGGAMLVYFDDLEYDGKREDFRHDPRWDGNGNQARFQNFELRDAQDFGWSPTNFAGLGRGEIGGTFWRTEPDLGKFGYYAAPVGPCSFREPLYASGRIAMTRAAADSGVYLGWFGAQAGGEPPNGFIGLRIEGPSRVGHYFRVAYRNQDGMGGDSETGPIIMPDGKKRVWTLLYDPAANDGQGILHATLDGEVVSLPLKPGHKTRAAVLDRFGFRTMRRGGHYVTMYVDDVQYVAGHRR